LRVSWDKRTFCKTMIFFIYGLATRQGTRLKDPPQYCAFTGGHMHFKC
jgi:hypothetical protein